MNERQARSSIQKLQKERDRAIIAIKKRIEHAYVEAIRRYASAWDRGADSDEWEHLQEQLREKYQKELTEAVASAEKEFRDKCADIFAELTEGLPSRKESSGEFANLFKAGKSVSQRNKTMIDRSGAMLSDEMRLLDKIRKDPQALEGIGPVRNGKLSNRQVNLLLKLLKDPQAAKRSGVDIYGWRKEVYGSNTPKNSASILGDTMEQELVKDNYVLQNSMSRQVPEILGYRISVQPRNKYGKQRTPDICDQFAGDYSKNFVFTGWHYNCRCVCRPLINALLLTPELEAKGFIGIPGNTEITRMPPSIAHSPNSIREYREKFPPLVQANYVDYHGETRLLSTLQPEEQIGHYLENFGQDFLRGAQGVKVTLSEPSDPEVFMDTRLEGDNYRFNISTRPASDGHNPAADLLDAFKQSNTGIPLNKPQLSAASDITHEMVHTMSKDYPFAQLEQMYPQWRDELMNFTIDPSSRERLALETLTEWYAREIFPEIAQKQGWELPQEYRSAVGTGYVNQVDNFNAFLRYVPDPAGFKQRLSDILRRGDKALAYRFLTDAVKQSGALKNARSATGVVNKIVDGNDPKDFEKHLEKTAAQPSRPVSADSAPGLATIDKLETTLGAAKTVTLIERAMRVEKELNELGLNGSRTIKQIGTGLEGLKKDAIFDLRLSSMSRGMKYLTGGLAIGLPITIATQRYKDSQNPSTPGELFPGYRRHLSPTLYTTVNNPTKNNYLEGLSAGVIDGLIDTAIATKDLISSVARYTGSGLMKLIGQALPPNPSQTGWHTTQYFDQINAQLGEIGSGLWDFLKQYYTDPGFQSEFDRQLIGEVKDYFTRLGGMTGDQGYAQGRLIVDIALFLQATGGLKGLMSQWKRTGRLDMTEYFSKMKLPPAKGVVKEIQSLPDSPPGVQNIKALPVSKKTPSVLASEQKALPAPATEPMSFMLIPTDRKTLGTQEEVSEMINGVKDHVFGIKKIARNKDGNYTFSGCHTKAGFDAATKVRINDKIYEGTPIPNVIRKNERTGVYEARPVIKLNNGWEITKKGNNGISTFFPDDWDRGRIMRAVNEAALSLGKKSLGKSNIFVGFSKTENMHIVLQYGEKKIGSETVKYLTSYYPLFE